MLKDDFSAVFGKHFVKAGFLVSSNKKNEEPANTSLESVQVNGIGRLRRAQRVTTPALTTNNTIANWLLSGMAWNTSRDPDQQARAAALEGPRVLRRGFVQDQAARHRGLSAFA